MGGPNKMINKYGANVVRLWVLSENYRQDIRLSNEILTRMQDAYRRIRNTTLYAREPARFHGARCGGV